jgi:5-methylcytosine-specific restriction endonuclease McrA
MARTLLLNASHEPMKTIHRHRAVNLVLESKAEVLERGEGYFSSPSVMVPVPLVIRLHQYRRVPYMRFVPVTTRGVLLRDSYECGYCGKQASTRDHVVPKAHGGVNEWENVVASCTRCNSLKGDRLLAELGWKLAVTPRQPYGAVAVRLSLGCALMHESWEPYLAAA